MRGNERQGGSSLSDVRASKETGMTIMEKVDTARKEVRDGMRIDWDVPIEMDDGLVLRADVYRPDKEGRYPVLMTYGPYAKGLAFQDEYPSAGRRVVGRHPAEARGSQ